MMKRFVLKATTAAIATVLTLAGPALQAAEMVLPSEVAATHWKTGYMNEFAETVKKRTNGALVVKVFPAGQLYNDQDAMAALGTGAAHMVWPVAVRLETIDPRTGIINLPFAITDEQMVNRCFADGLTKFMSAYVEPRKLQSGQLDCQCDIAVSDNVAQAIGMHAKEDVIVAGVRSFAPGAQGDGR